MIDAIVGAAAAEIFNPQGPSINPCNGQPTNRQWTGLTDEEIKSIEETTTCLGDESWLRNLTRNLEAKLKGKNTCATSNAT